MMNIKTSFLDSQRGRTLIFLALALSASILTGILTANNFLLILIAPLLILAGFAIITRPDLITLAVVFILYTNAAVIAVKFHGLPFVVGASIPMLLVIPFIYKLIFQHQKPVIDLNMLLLLGLLLVKLIGTLIAKDAKIAAADVITFMGEGILLYFLIVNIVQTPETMRRVIWALLIAGAFLGGLSFYQQITGTFHNNYWGFAQVGGATFGTGVQSLQGEIQQARLDGPIGEKNYYAQILVTLIPLGLIQFQGERSKLLRLVASIVTITILLGIALTFSRGVMIGFVLMLLVMTFMRYIKLQHFILVLVGVYLLFQLFPQYGLRLSSLQPVLAITEEDSAGVAGTDVSTQGRIGEMLAAWLVFLDHPVVGVGPGMFNSYYPEYADRVGLKIHTGTRAAHDIFLGIAADNGLVGLALFLLLVIVSLRRLENSRRQMLKTHPDVANMATGFFLSIISYLGTGLFLSFAYERYFWLILGLGGALQVIATKQISSVNEDKALTRSA